MADPKISELTKPMVQEKDYWIDPDPNSTGLLLSDRIKFYIDKVNLVFPFNDESLRPASYTLHAGTGYLLNLKTGMKEGNLEEDKVVEIPPNGLIYIRFYEEINLPFYMIARFNLRVKQVYRGLLLGTGPQVDPGFRGHLNCPIHNFTDEPKQIKFRDQLATIDFEKTTKLGEQYFSGKSNTEIDALPFAKMRRNSDSISGLGGLPCKIFPIMNDRPIRDYLPGGESVRSSVFELHEQVKHLGAELDFYRKISIWGGVGGLLAIITLALTMYFHIEDYFFNSYREMQDKFHDISLSVDRLKESDRTRSQIVASPPSATAKKSEPGPAQSKKVDGIPTQDKQSSK